MLNDDGFNVYEVYKNGMVIKINSKKLRTKFELLVNPFFLKDKLLNSFVLDDYIKNNFYYNKDNLLIYKLLFETDDYIKNFFLLNKNDLYLEIINIICSNKILTINKKIFKILLLFRKNNIVDKIYIYLFY